MVDFNRNVHCLLGLPVDAVTLGDAVARIRSAADGASPCFLSTPNLNFVTTALDDAAFRASILESDLSTADGMPLVWIARLLGIPIRERVAGSSVFAALRADPREPPHAAANAANAAKKGATNGATKGAASRPRRTGAIAAGGQALARRPPHRHGGRPGTAAPPDAEATARTHREPPPGEPGAASADTTADAGRLSVFFFGGPPGVAAAAASALASRGGGLRAAGWHDPGFVDVATMSDPAVIAGINASGADFLVVALGARKGQEWIRRNRSQLKIPVISHLGAVINFAAGTVSPAPRWVQRAGLEWLWRIKEEPALWRRYARDAAHLQRLLLTRVLPQAVEYRLRRWLPAGRQPATISISPQVGRIGLQLAGDWRHDNLAPLRRCLAHAARTPQPVDIDLAAVRRIDSAFLGLLLLLHGHQHAVGQPLRLTGARRGLRRAFRYGCAEFLLAAPAD